jgi:hypothetical protein
MPDGDICGICGHRGVLHSAYPQVDHIIPYALGGTDDLDNLWPAHGSGGAGGSGDGACPTCGEACNQRKKARILELTYSSRDW